MNYKLLLTSCAALALAAVSSTYAAGRAFVRPVLAYTSPTDSSYDDAAYFGVVGGAFLGKNKEHEFSGEIGAMGWEYDEQIGSIRAESTEAYVPFLANYRYYVNLDSQGKGRFFFGPSLGFTFVGYEAEGSGPGVYIKDDSAEVRFSAAASLGFEGKLNDRLTLQGGYRYLYIDGGNTELFGTTFDVEEFDVHQIFVGLTISF